MPAIPEEFSCFLVRKTEETIQGAFERRPLSELPAGSVLIRTLYSSLNYKDAMTARGNAGIAKKYPHVPGIDAAGIVEHSDSPEFRRGDEVISTGHELGVERWGGWAEFIRVPAEWVLPRPAGLTLEEAMILGTAGFTAGQCVAALLDHGISPGQGKIVVTGATGGVGIISVKLLAKLGFNAVAVSGKDELRDWLTEQGAVNVMSRNEFLDRTTRPLLAARYAGGIDAVGGEMLSTLLRSTDHRGCIANCGVVGGAEIPVATVYPFILRGVTLTGIDSAWCPDDRRAEIWRRLSQEWKLDDLTAIANFVTLAELPDAIQEILRGRLRGRTVVRVAATS